jgi:RNA-binding protein YlmH
MSDVERDLLNAVRGGRVAATAFLPPAEADALAQRLRAAGCGVSVDGGRVGAQRRIVVAHPLSIPTASAKLAAVHYAGVVDAGDVLAAARAAGIASDQVGDAVVTPSGLTLIALAAAAERLLALRAAPGVVASAVPLTALPQGAEASRGAIVPSLRVDALGAKAFGVSRSYFAKGIAAGRVHVSGRLVGKSAEAAEGDVVWAEGLGRFRVVAVTGETRRGNLKVTIEVERDAR